MKLAEANMRTLLAIVIFAGGVLALDSPADAARKSKRGAKPPSSYQQKKVDLACEERARHEDPTGDFAGYPCWAREALARGRNINRD
jgi:hypothetical protein